MPTNPAFTVSPSSFDIPARRPFTITLGCMPSELTNDGMITITSNAANTPSLPVTLTCAGLAGRLVAPKVLVIKSSGVGQMGSANLVLRNAGKGILMGSVANATSPFGGGGGGGTIQPGKTNPSPITITYTPTATGIVKQPLTITVQSPSTPASVTVTLEGIAK
jgi:hypothetical protein